MNILTKIKERSDGKKKIFSLVMATILTLVIVMIWYSFIDDQRSKQIAGKEEVNTLSSLSPIQVIKDEFSRTFSSISDTLSGSSSSSSDAVSIEIVTENLSSTNTEEIMSTSTTEIIQ